MRGKRGRRTKELRALASALILHERIETTHARARLTRVKVEKMITRAKIPGLATLRLLRRGLPLLAAKKVLEVFSTRYQNRPGGYTRILHAGKFKDGTAKVILELVK